MNALVLNKVTMTSLELVDFINSQRKEGDAELRHDNFMAKVPKVLGEEGVLNFKDTYVNAQNGQTYSCYRFPKRESCLMAMSYSYELQAKVFDRMTKLEEEQKPQADLAVIAQPIFESSIAYAKLFGLEGNQALLSADRATERYIGFSPMKFLQIELKKEVQALNLTPTEIGKQLNPPISAIKVNKTLESLGYQEKLGDSWVPTQKGKPYAVFIDTGKKHSDGTPITQLKWFDTILENL